MKLIVFLAASISVCVGAFGQQASPVLPPQPHLFHLWTDAAGETHIQEIKLGNNRRPAIPGVTMNFSGTPAGPNAKNFHNSPAHQFAVTVSGKIDVEASDGSKAHLETGDMFFLEDTKGKGHKTLEEGASSIFLRVPDDFNVDTWARGN
jgi:hypothetical protein